MAARRRLRRIPRGARLLVENSFGESLRARYRTCCPTLEISRRVKGGRRPEPGPKRPTAERWGGGRTGGRGKTPRKRGGGATGGRRERAGPPAAPAPGPR